MAHNAEELASSGQLDPLRDALDSAFLESDESLRPPAIPNAPEPTGGGDPSETPLPALEEAAPSDEGWKAEYDQRLAAWRAEAAIARQKAEEERGRWAEIRETERAQERRREEEREREEAALRRSRAGSEQEWESVGGSQQGGGVSRQAKEEGQVRTERREADTRARLGGAARAAAQVDDSLEGESMDEDSVADARDLTRSEMEGGSHMFDSSVVSVPSMGSTPPTLPSAFPTDTESPVEVSNGDEKSSPDVDADESSLNESQPREKPTPRRRPGPSRIPPPAAALAEIPAQKETPAPTAIPKSLTISVFSPDLPLRTRLLALFSTLAINVALPFINGVMLGFGEIFARNYIAVWIGWTKRPKGTATAVGVRY